MSWVHNSMRHFYGYNWVGAKTLYPLMDLTELYDNKGIELGVGYILYGGYKGAMWEEVKHKLNRTVREFSQEPESYVLNILFLDNVSYYLTGEL